MRDRARYSSKPTVQRHRLRLNRYADVPGFDERMSRRRSLERKEGHHHKKGKHKRIENTTLLANNIVLCFVVIVCLYLTDFYQLSPQSGTGERNLTVAEATSVHRSTPFAFSKASGAVVKSLPGAIQSTGKSFESLPQDNVERNPNTLPGAIGLDGSFDSHDGGGKKSQSASPGDPVTTAKQSADDSTKRKKKLSKSLPPEKSAAVAERASSTERKKISSTSAGTSKPKKKRKKKRKKKKTLAKRKTSSGANGGAGTKGEAKGAGSGKPTKIGTARDGIEGGSTSDGGEDTNLFEGSHPMNRNMEELQVAGGTGKLEESAVRDAYSKLVQAYLAPFASGIKRRSFFEILRRKTYSLTPPGANKGIQTVLFQIADKKVYMMDPYEVKKNSKPFYRSRVKELIWLLSEIAKDGTVPNTEFLLAIHDCVQTVHKEHTYRGAVYKESNPTFTIVSCNFSDNIPFPMWEGDEVRGGLKSWDEKMASYKKQDTIEWKDKKEQAVFRGGNRPSMYFKAKKDANDHCDDVGRSRLRYVGETNAELFDVGVSGTCGGKSFTMSRLSESQHHNYKYILYAEGNCFWADRLNKQVFGPSAIIKQETPCGQFWEPLLKPMTHYIPTDFFFQNVVDQVAWAKSNDAKVQEIVKNSNEFAANFLSFKGIKTYVEVMLTEYTKLLASTSIKPEKGAEDVTV